MPLLAAADAGFRQLVQGRRSVATLPEGPKPRVIETMRRRMQHRPQWTRCPQRYRGARRLSAVCRRLALVPALWATLASSAQAQTRACDDFKAVLAARIESTGVRGYALETAPAAAALPPDAKVIGTCESGTFKILYRRWGAAPASSGAASAARAASDAQAGAVPDAQPQRAPGARAERASPALPASAPGLVPAPVSRSNKAAATLAVAAPEPVRPLAGSSNDVAAVRPSDLPAAAPPAPVSTGTAAEPAAPLTRLAVGFVAGHWQWIGALGLVVLLGGTWLWRTYFSAYDKDGLPRGPRL